MFRSNLAGVAQLGGGGNTAMLTTVRRWLPRVGLKVQDAQAMVEYALILVLVAIVVIIVLISLGQGITNTFQTIVNRLK
jgi:Flp pilus assembly pilin Flp